MVTTRGQAGLVAAASAEAVAAAAEEAAAAEAASDAAAFDQHAADVEVFVEMGAEIMGKSPPSLLKKKQVTTTTAFEERWTAHFNAEPEVCFDVWQRLLEDNDDMENERPCHLLWALLYLQVYSTEPVLSGMCGCDEETFRSHVDTIVQKISFLEPDVIIWENWLVDDVGNKCKITVDGVDCIVEQRGKVWYSQKFKRGGLRYELGICICTGDLVWIHGPFPPGDWNDLMIFRHALKHQLHPGECVEADDGYKAEDPEVVRAPAGVRAMEDMRWHMKRSKARRRHETINQRIKQYSVLTDRFRNDINKHSACFGACAILTQLSFDFGKRAPFEVNDYDEVWKNPLRAPLPGDVVPGDEDYDGLQDDISL